MGKGSPNRGLSRQPTRNEEASLSRPPPCHTSSPLHVLQPFPSTHTPWSSSLPLPPPPHSPILPLHTHPLVLLPPLGTPTPFPALQNIQHLLDCKGPGAPREAEQAMQRDRPEQKMRERRGVDAGRRYQRPGVGGGVGKRERERERENYNTLKAVMSPACSPSYQDGKRSYCLHQTRG